MPCISLHAFGQLRVATASQSGKGTSLKKDKHTENPVYWWFSEFRVSVTKIALTQRCGECQESVKAHEASFNQHTMVVREIRPAADFLMAGGGFLRRGGCIIACFEDFRTQLKSESEESRCNGPSCEPPSEQAPCWSSGSNHILLIIKLANF